jgi:hypothetical protein
MAKKLDTKDWAVFAATIEDLRYDVPKVKWGTENRRERVNTAYLEARKLYQRLGELLAETKK